MFFFLDISMNHNPTYDIIQLAKVPWIKIVTGWEHLKVFIGYGFICESLVEFRSFVYFLFKFNQPHVHKSQGFETNQICLGANLSQTNLNK